MSWVKEMSEAEAVGKVFVEMTADIVDIRGSVVVMVP
jgi:hypothetical protein